MRKLFFMFVCLIMACFMCSCNNSVAVPSSNLTSSTDSISEEETLKNEWNYDEKTDEMTDTKKYFASLVSENSIELEFPYGECMADLTIRNTKKGGNEVMIMVSSGQIFGNEFDGANFIEVRFDKNPVKKYMFSESESLNSNVIFINNSKDFIENCKKAKDIKIKIPMFQEGRPLFTFHVDKTLSWLH